MKKILILLTILTLTACQNTFPEDDFNPILEEEFDTSHNLVEEGKSPNECEGAVECPKEEMVELAEIVNIDRPTKSTLELTTTYRDTSCKLKQQVYADANTTETYINEEYGFELKVPYNPKWGTIDYKLPVAETADLEEYEQGISKIIWGQLIFDPHVGCTRPFKILITEPRTVDQALSAYWQEEAIEGDHRWGFEIEPTSYVVNGLQMAEFISDGPLCAEGAVEVFTSKFNLYFTTGCYSENFHDQFKKLVQTLDFL